MRNVIAALLLAACPLACGAADDKKDEKVEAKKDEPKKAKLGLGDKAPALKVSQWLNGAEPKTFEKDKVYVLEFWATWCGPCIAAMPHLSELQKANKDKGLVIIGLTSKDDIGNDQKSVTEFVDKNKGGKLGYVVGYSDDTATNEAYMAAAGRNGIPCSFVVGKDGTIAYIGHPMNLDDVLPKVLAGTWSKADGERLMQREADLDEVFSQPSTDAALEKMTAFVKKYPEKAQDDDIRGVRFSLLVQAKKFDDAKPLAEEMIAASEKGKKGTPAAYAVVLAIPEANPDKKHAEVGLKALETALKYEEKDLQLLVTGVQVYTAAGEKDKAAALAKKAVAAAPNDMVKKRVEEVLERIQKMK